MIILDTHIWIWWVDGSPKLPLNYQAHIQANESLGLGVSIISCWEVAKLVEYRRLTLKLSVKTWLDEAIHYPGIRLFDLTPSIVVESTQLPGAFHRDPADRLIVATARIFDCPLMTFDVKILTYPHVKICP